MKDKDKDIQYPRRVFLRNGMTTLAKILLALLADVKISGVERLPEKGPIILAGNHVEVLEAVMMAAYTPAVVEFLGTGDIPFDPNYGFIANTYGLIPVNRGNLDRKGLNMALSVLEQDGILGVFPEGGTWDPAQMQAQIGAAWLSYRAQVPILPIGFGGIKDGLSKALQLKRPKLIMNVGNVIPPVKVVDDDISLKANLELASKQILKEINALIPKKDLHRFRRRVDETYNLEIEIHKKGETIEPPKAYQVKHGAAYARFLYNPIMMDVLARNLGLPIQPIRKMFRRSDLDPVLEAWRVIIAYLNENPGYFTYRFGVEGGLAGEKALLELIELCEWVQDNGYSITIDPIQRYHNANTGADVIERGGCFPKSMR